MTGEETPEELEHIEQQKKWYQEARALYEWWTEIRPNREKTLPEFPKFPEDWPWLPMIIKTYAKEPIMIEWNRVAKFRSEAEVRWSEEDIEMLTRLAKIHKGMWI